jgi:alkylhydroperoxidase/carboxymuconolactone decarboxylase family protein YurZ
MSDGRGRAAKPAAKSSTSSRPNVKAASPYGYPFWDWLAREDPDFVRAREPVTALSVGEGKALSIKYREMVILGILLFRGGSSEGILAHMRRAIQHGATKRELLEAIYAAAVPGGGPTLSSGVKALMELDAAGAFKNG